jgi:hypothetical protein
MLRERTNQQPGPLNDEDYSRVLARVALTERALGGLVRDSSLDRVLERELGARRQALGRNWELLRQAAEAQGLIFQPIAADGEAPVAAMIWVSRTDLATGRRRAFRSKFLDIRDPWKDPALRDWKGLSERWQFDSSGRRTDDAAQSVRSEEMIPLALYSLDHPKAPFLLIDFRTPWKPAFREAARRTVEEIPSTMLGVAAFTNFQLRGAQVAWNFIRGRQGAAIHRSSRLRAAASVRQVVFTAAPVEPELREQMAKRLGATAPSPLGRYHDLLTHTRLPDGMQRRIQDDRGRELAKLLHPARTRWLNLVTFATGGIYRYRVQPSPEYLALLGRERGLATAAHTVEAALAASPRVDIGSDLGRLRRAAQELAAVPSVRPAMRERANRLLIQLAQQTGDDQLRREFLALLNEPREAAPAAAAVSGGGND